MFYSVCFVLIFVCNLENVRGMVFVCCEVYVCFWYMYYLFWVMRIKVDENKKFNF